MPGPVFREGERVALCPIETEDAEFLQRLVNDPRVRRGTGHDAPRSLPQQHDTIEEITDADDHASFLVTADGDRVGCVALYRIDRDAGHAEVGYFLAPQSWGNGYATDACREAVAHAFEEMRLHKVYARLFAGNDASRRVLERVGFRKEGHFREHLFHDGAYRDRLQYGLTAAEWRGR